MEDFLFNKKDFNNLKLNNSNFKLLNTEEEKKEYLKLYSVYGKFFISFIIKKLDLKKYDDIIAKSELKLKKNNYNKMSIYQVFSSDALSYFYIRNHFYIERLSDDDKNYLLSKFNNTFKLDDKIEKIIEKTYKQVIFEDALGNGAKCKILYGPDSSTYLKPNNSLIIGFSYDEYFKEGMKDREWFDLHYEQMEFYRKIFDEMQESWNNILDIPVSIIKYNNYLEN